MYGCRYDGCVFNHIMTASYGDDYSVFSSGKQDTMVVSITLPKNTTPVALSLLARSMKLHPGSLILPQRMMQLGRAI